MNSAPSDPATRLASDAAASRAPERRLGAEGAQALAEDDQLGAALGRELRPAPVDVPVQGDAGLGGLVPVDQERDPARQVGVLQADQCRVAAVQVLERAGGVGVDPAGAGGGDHAQDLPLEGARPLQLPHGQRGPLVGRASRPQPGVDPDRLQHLARRPVEGAQLGRGRGAGDEGAAVLAEGRPGHQRRRAARGGGAGGRHHAGSVVVSAAAKRRLAQSRNPSTTTSRVRTTAAATNTAAVIAWASRRGSRRASSLSSSGSHGRPGGRPGAADRTRPASPRPSGPAPPATAGRGRPGPRCWFCHPGHSASPATTTAAPATPSACHQRRGPPARCAAEPAEHGRHAVPGQRPQQVPMAADSPLTAPWRTGHGAACWGPSDHHQKSSAPAAPPKVGRRNSQPRCGAPLTSYRSDVGPPGPPGPAPGSGGGACRGWSRGPRP